MVDSQAGERICVCGSVSQKILSVFLAVLLAAGMMTVAPSAAYAFDGPKQDAYNAETAMGASDDPYRILVTKIGDPEQTRPSAFWSGTGNNAASGEDSFIPFAVTFEQREGNTADGALVSSLSFDMHDGAGRHAGAAALGPVLAGGEDGLGADVWSGIGSSSQASWVYAFRLSPYTAQDTSTGDLRLSFAWRGCFGTYFDDWEYAFDAVSATAGLAEDKRVKPGDTIVLSYYGGYDVNQTSRGTGYRCDFGDTSTVNSSSSALSVLGDPTDATYEAVVGEDGMARFSGANSIQYGGNYAVSIKKSASEPRPAYAGGQGGCVVTLSGFDAITTEEGTSCNFIENKIDASSEFAFSLEMKGSGWRWSPDRYAGNAGVDAWLVEYVYPFVTVEEADGGSGGTVASRALGNLNCISYDPDTPCTNMVFSVPANTFAEGKSYILKLGSSLACPNVSTTSGTDITFSFSTARSGEAVEANKTALNRVINQVKADIATVSVSADGSDVSNTALWVTENEKSAIDGAVAAASSVASDKAATQDAVDGAETALTGAWDTFKSQKKTGKRIDVAGQWNIGKESPDAVVAVLYTDGSLVISGAGDTQSFASENDIPWKSSRSSVTTARFEGSVSPTNLDYYFTGCSNLSSVTGIPDGVISMKQTFGSCTSLKTPPKLPDSVSNLNYTFQYCSALESIASIPADATSMTGTFSHCSSLKAVPAVPDGVEDMSQTFWNATALESVAGLPASAKSYSYTFQGCTALRSCPAIPEGATHLIGMFDGCSSLLKAPAIPEGVRMLFNAFRGCSALFEVGVIPQTVTDCTRAFANCTSLVELPAGFAIPEGATTTDMFKVDGYASDNPLETYTSSADAVLASYDWVGSNRKLVKSSVWEVGKDNPADVVAALLENGTLVVSGSGAMRDFASAEETPWSQQAQSVERIRIEQGVTALGAFAFSGLSNEALTGIRLPSGVTAIGEQAFADCANVLTVDLTACVGSGEGALASIGDGAFCGVANGATVYVADKRAASLVKCLPADAVGRTGGNVDRVFAALAVTGGGSLPEGYAFTDRELVASVEKSGWDFVKWTTDESNMHPASSWKALSSGTVYYAKYAKSEVIVSDPLPYPGMQGLDQTVMLLDLSKLPGSAAKQTDVVSYGSDAGRFLNRITTPYNGNQDVVFAFNMGRGGNANGGDGAYQKSFSLPYVSVLDEEGNVVASYENGSGKLRLFSTVFDGVDGKEQGNSITAFRIGVKANELPAGTYTLRFGKGFGANNGTSFLDKNVDFLFTVEAASLYELVFDTSGEDAVVTGVTLTEGAEGVDAYIPDTVGGRAVTGIAAGAFRSASKVASITVPDSVTSVGDEAFADMAGLEYVKMSGIEDAAGVPYNPAWGERVFTGSASCLLYGWPQIASIKEAADAYANVTFCPLEDGVYVNGKKLGSETIRLDADAPYGVSSVVRSGEIVTDEHTGYLSNVNVVGHAGTTRGLWQDLTAKADGTAVLAVRDSSGALVAQGAIETTGFGVAASTSRTVLEPGTYQGNGSTVMLSGAGAIETADFDETLRAFDNYLIEPMVAQGAVFELNLGGPGSAWPASRWDWDDWTANHLNDYVYLQDADGNEVASVGAGLTWIDLGGTNFDNKIVLSVDPGVLEVGNSYTLVCGADMTGHNVAARLMKDVRWTFAVRAADINGVTAADIPAQIYEGLPLEPAVELSAPVPATRLWNEAEEAYVHTPANARALTEGVDYRVSYRDNNALGTGKAVIEGLGAYAGSTKTIEFSITDPAGAALSELNSVIDEATTALDAVSASEDGTDVPSGQMWVTPGAKSDLHAAIDAAKAVAGAQKPQIGDLQAATADLTAALSSFNDLKQPGKKVDPVDPVEPVDPVGPEAPGTGAENGSGGSATLGAGADALAKTGDDVSVAAGAAGALALCALGAACLAFRKRNRGRSARG